MENYQFVNLTFLNHFTSGKKEMMIPFIQKFLDTTPKDILEMERCLNEKDWRTLRVTAHSLKPQLSYMGISQLEQVIKTIENNAGEQINLEEIPGLLDEVKKICGQASTELSQIITSLR